MPGRTPRSSWSVVALTLLVIVGTAPPAWAWGRLGHRVISRLAEQRLTPKAKAAAAELLEPGESLADASLWADEHRRQMPKTAPWHYVDVPLDEPRYDARFSGDDPKKGCVVDKITEFRATLKDPSKSKEDTRFALRFLIHCIEDLHQPCHVGDNHDRGGNDTQVRFFDRGTNMHRLWDSDMIEWNTRSEDVWLAELTELDTDRNRAAWTGGSSRGLGDRVTPRGPCGLSGAGDRCADQARPEAIPRILRRPSSGRAASALSGRCAAPGGQTYFQVYSGAAVLGNY